MTHFFLYWLIHISAQCISTLYSTSFIIQGVGGEGMVRLQTRLFTKTFARLFYFPLGQFIDQSIHQDICQTLLLSARTVYRLDYSPKHLLDSFIIHQGSLQTRLFTKTFARLFYYPLGQVLSLQIIHYDSFYTILSTRTVSRLQIIHQNSIYTTMYIIQTVSRLYYMYYILGQFLDQYNCCCKSNLVMRH